MQYYEIPLSKHDDSAYTGKMDRLTYSKSLYHIVDQLYDMQEEYVENTNEKELVNSFIREKNNVISEVIKMIEKEGVQTLNSTWAFDDEGIYKYHVKKKDYPKSASSIEDLLDYHINNHSFKCFRDLIYKHFHNYKDESNNKEILEYAKNVEELKDYKTAKEVFNHIIDDLLKKDFNN